MPVMVEGEGDEKMNEKEILICVICHQRVDKCNCSIRKILEYPVWLKRVKIEENKDG
jgi:hypothetical protein